jgi:DNA-binding CsgD family transcriptional regulator
MWREVKPAARIVEREETMGKRTLIDREEVARLVGMGKSVKEIAKEMDVQNTSIYAHVAQIRRNGHGNGAEKFEMRRSRPGPRPVGPDIVTMAVRENLLDRMWMSLTIAEKVLLLEGLPGK